MGLLSRFMHNQPDSGKIHSSGIAAVNDGSPQAVGAMRRGTYAQRATSTAGSRQHISSTYRNSLVAQRDTTQPPLSAAKTDTTNSPSSVPSQQKSVDGIRPSRQQMNAERVAQPSVHRANFSNPPSRGYNPYG